MLSRLQTPARHLLHLWRGYSAYRQTGETPAAAYYALRYWHWRSAGRITDWLWLQERKRAPAEPTGCNGALGSCSVAQLREVAAEIGREGFYVFPQLLPTTACDALEAFARSTPALPRSGSDENLEPTVYDAAHPLAPAYDFAETQLWANPAVAELANDPTLLNLATAYLECAPVLDLIAMWWSSAGSGAPVSAAAQLFHFDLDRIKWLKFFVYLTDVSAETGPHVFLRGSQRRTPASAALLGLGDRRLTDDEVFGQYPPQAAVEIVGPRGTIIAVDTSGYHKGKPPVMGDRLILQLEYSAGLFGAPYMTVPLPQPLAVPGLSPLQKVKNTTGAPA